LLKKLIFYAAAGASVGRSASAKKYSFLSKRLSILIWANFPTRFVNKKSYR
jgi:hypothetical protein